MTGLAGCSRMIGRSEAGGCQHRVLGMTRSLSQGVLLGPQGQGLLESADTYGYYARGCQGHISLPGIMSMTIIFNMVRPLLTFFCMRGQAAPKSKTLQAAARRRRKASESHSCKVLCLTPKPKFVYRCAVGALASLLAGMYLRPLTFKLSSKEISGNRLQVQPTKVQALFGCT